MSDQIKQALAAGCIHLLSVRHDCPTEWARFQPQTPPANHRHELKISRRPEHYPFWSQGRLQGVTRVDLLGRPARSPVPAGLLVDDRADKADTAVKTESPVNPPAVTGLLSCRLQGGSGTAGGSPGIDLPASPVGDLTFCFDQRDLADLWLVIAWHGP